MNSERRFWSAIGNSMSTPSVVRTLTDGGSGNQVIQDYRFHYSPQQVIENKVDFTQKSATVDTKVVTEGIIFPQEQYLRYTKFKDESNGQSTSNLDSVMDKWAFQQSDDEEEARQNYLSEYVTLAIFGNFNAEQRRELLDELRDNNVYNIDFDQVTEEVFNSSKVNVYQVSVNLRSFVQILNEAFVKAGYGEFAALNPENYREGSMLNAVFRVAKNNNSIVGISFGDREEVYSNYGVIKDIDAPEANLTIDELQTEVQEQLQ